MSDRSRPTSRRTARRHFKLALLVLVLTGFLVVLPALLLLAFVVVLIVLHVSMVRRLSSEIAALRGDISTLSASVLRLATAEEGPTLIATPPPPVAAPPAVVTPLTRVSS